MAIAKPPAELGKAGRKLWRDILSDLDREGVVLDSRELDWLLQAAKTADSVAALESAMASQSLVVKGVAGQPVAHPLLSEIRQHRSLQAQLLARLDFQPSSAGTGSSPRSTQARRAAQTRWAG